MASRMPAGACFVLDEDVAPAAILRKRCSAQRASLACSEQALPALALPRSALAFLKPTHSVHVTPTSQAPAQAVRDRSANHAQTPTWVKAARVQLLSPGSPEPSGVGALREVSFPQQPLWSRIQERLTAFQAPSTFSYTISHGMLGLRGHLGTLRVERRRPWGS